MICAYSLLYLSSSFSLSAQLAMSRSVPYMSLVLLKIASC